MTEFRGGDGVTPSPATVLHGPSRLAAVDAVRAIDDRTGAAFTRSAELAARLLGTGMALISLAGIDRQFVRGGTGAAVPRSGEQRGLDWAFCSEVVASGRPLVIDDLRDAPGGRADGAVADTGMRAYLGVPLLLGGLPVGALCVLDTGPRSWDPGQRHALEQLGESVMSEIGLRLDAAESDRLHARTAATAAVERQRSQQLRDLARASLRINATPSLDHALQTVTEEARRLVGTHQSITSMTRDLRWGQAINAVSLSDKYAAYRSFDAPPVGEGIYVLVCRENRPMRMTQDELEAHPAWRGFGEYASRHPPMRGWLAVPLITSDGRNLGLIQLSDKEDGGEFTADDEAILVQLAQLASASIEKAAALESQYEIARTLQSSLLPQRLPEQSAVSAASRYLPATPRAGVGGDWFDVIALSGARVALVVGDVVGHGIHAAATMGRLRTAVRTLADVDPTPEELLTRLDDLVSRPPSESDTDTDDRLGLEGEAALGATCLYAVYDPVAGRCALACAGHPVPVVVSPDGHAGLLDVPVGPPLGVGGVPFETAEVDVPEGSLLAFYTDGLVESRSRDLDAGTEELRRILAVPGESLETLCDDVVRALLPEPPADDAALLLVRPHSLDRARVATWDIGADPAEVARVRARVARRLATWGLDEIGFVTELVVSELITNAIRYGLPPLQLRLIHDRTVICEVSDTSGTAPHLRRATALDEGGRGLMLVARLTQRWGTRQAREGKTIWCEQALPPTGPPPGSR
ncbi:SpoIIE family protein phosphatase [Streptomyces sp. SHP 1-2]|uniref:SpoIIE family protein phosphatase n=1 Tax=Streptomyces sp. SHP 1-2 TaxID=2769489 RepID=UPI0022382945|nr:SpoIIE family protein phosphatase [Streptomyces sp. SHP 1-2]MCW5253175.1 SpoIIE family protein phosphatase [Streptomyces sp. SHP 1-2]